MHRKNSRSDFKLPSDLNLSSLIDEIGAETVTDALSEMVLIRHFETRGEAAYQQGFVGGFYHVYSGEEAIATSAVYALGMDNWYISTYRCHALALLLGASPEEVMAELYGRENGNAKGRGGSMHLFSERLLGGFAIVGGHLPIAVGAAFALKYQEKEGEIAVCFLGEGAVPQGAFHEALNLAALWDLPVLFIIENNQWGMGTHVSRAVAAQPIAEKQAVSYGISGYTLDGTDFLQCYGAFKAIKEEILKKKKPVLVECICERFKGHSISDPGLYRSKENLHAAMEKDPIIYLKETLFSKGFLDEETFKEIDKKQKERVLQAMKYAESSPWPSLATLEEDVYAP